MRPGCPNPMFTLAIWMLTSFGGASSQADSWTFQVTAPDRTINDCPVSIPLPRKIHDGEILLLKRLDSESSIPVQQSSPESAMFILDAELKQNESRQYELSTFEGKVDELLRVICQHEDGLLNITVDGRPVLSYHVAVAEPPEGVDSAYRRSGFIHPVLTPKGRTVTDDFPEDHLHQHAIFGAWVKTEFEGRQVDFWNQLKGTGTVRHSKLVSFQSGNVFAEFVVNHEFVDLTQPDSPQVALEESWKVRVYATRTGNCFDIESRQSTATDSPLHLLEYHYGGMAVRGSGQWSDQPEANFLTSEGNDRSNGNHSRPNWVSIHGRVDDQMCGLAMFSSLENFRAPQPVRLHPKMPYFVFAPVVLGEFAINPGDEYLSQYRYLAYDGEPNPEHLETIWNGYSSNIRVQQIK